MAEKAYGEMGAENLNSQQNHSEISPRNLQRGGTRNPIRVDFLQRVTINTGDAFIGVDTVVKEFFVLPFPQQDKISLTHRRNYNYDAGQ